MKIKRKGEEIYERMQKSYGCREREREREVRQFGR